MANEDKRINQDVTFDETLQQDSINSALGKTDAKPATGFTLSGNAKTIQSTVKPFATQSIKPTLSEEESNAQLSGFNDAENQVIHSDESNLAVHRYNTKRSVVEQDTLGKPTLSDTMDNIPEMYDISKASDLSVSDLYKKTLALTAYDDIKFKCGLSRNDSYTDYYNRTGFVPKGYEKEARLLLAEEKRMKEYARYEAGEISKTDFLYNTYGKDLLKESGYDLSNPIFWYNRAKQGDFSNPLDNDLILSNLITNAEQLFQAEKWYQSLHSKTIDQSFVGEIVGTKIKEDKVYELFKNQFDAISEATDMTTKEIITYYQAGSLSGVFNPLVDIDGDGKYDYYYHTNGKMYAIEGSSGVGKATASIEYNSDGSVHEIEVKEGVNGNFGGFLEGLGNFFVGTFMDLTGLVWSATFGNFFNDSDDGYFVEDYARWKAMENRVLSNSDKVVLDNTHDWGYEIAQGIGTITGQVALQVVLAIFTYGAGNAATITGEVAGRTAVGLAVGAAAGAATGAITESIAADKQDREFNWDAVGSMAITGAVAGAAISGGSTYAGIAKELANTTKTTANVFQKVIGGVGKVISYTQRFNSGGVFPTATLAGSFGNAATLALKDMLSTWGNLGMANKVLKFYEAQDPESGLHPLSNGEILGRSLIVGAVDLGVSGLLRLNGNDGLTTHIKETFRIGGKESHSAVKAALKGLSNEGKSAILNGVKLMSPFMDSAVDNIADVVENLITAGTQAAVNNPYAKLGSKESRETFWKTMISPQMIIQNLYITAQNFGVFDGTGTFENRNAAILLGEVENLSLYADDFFRMALDQADTDEAVIAIQRARTAYEQIRAGKADDNGFPLDPTKYTTDNYYENELKASRFIAELFDDEFISAHKSELDTKYKLEDGKSFSDTITGIAKKMNESATGNQVNNYILAMAVHSAKEKAAKVHLETYEKLLTFIKDSYENKKTLFSKFAKGYTIKKIYDEQGKVVGKEKVETLRGNWKKFVERLNGVVKTQEMKDAINSFEFEKLIDIKYRDELSTDAIEAVNNATDEFYDTIFLTSESAVTEERVILEKMLKNKQIVEALKQAGTIKVEEDGSIKFLDNPLMIVSLKNDQVNNARASNVARYLKTAYEALAKLSTTIDENGEYLINSDMPFLLKFTLDSDSTEGGSKDYYILPTGADESALSVISKLQASNTLVAAFYQLQAATSKEELDKALITIGKYRTFGFVTGDTIGLDGVDAREDIKNIDKIRGIALLLHLCNMDESKELTLGRDLITKLCTFQKDSTNGITIDDLNKIIDNKDYFIKRGIVTETSVKQAEMLKSYLTKIDEYNDVITFLTKLKADSEEGKQTAVPILGAAKLRKFLADLNKTENKWLKDALLKDNRIQSKLLQDMINDPGKANPFCEALDVLAKPLVHSVSSQNYSKEEQQIISNYLNNYLLAGYNSVIDTYEGERSFNQRFNDLLTGRLHSDEFTNIPEMWDAFKQIKTTLADTLESKEHALLASYRDLVVDLQKKYASAFKRTYSKKTGEAVSNVTSSNTAAVLHTLLNHTEVNTIDKFFDIVKTIYDSAGTQAELEVLNTKLDTFLETNKALISEMYNDVGEAVFKYANEMYFSKDSVLEMWNSLVALTKLYSKDKVPAELNKLLEKYSLLHSEAQSIYYPRTAIFTAREIARDLFDTLKNAESIQNKTLSLYTKMIKEIREERAAAWDEVHGLVIQKKSYIELLNLSPSERALFLKDPVTTIETIMKEKIKHLNKRDPNYKAIKANIQEITKEITSTFATPEDILLAVVKLSDTNITDINSLCTLLNGTDTSETKDLINYAMHLASGKLSHNPDNFKYEVINGKLVCEGKDVFSILTNTDTAVREFFIRRLTAEEDVTQQVLDDIRKYHNYINKGTTVIAADNKVRINLVDFIPANLSKLLDLYQQSKDFYGKTELETKLDDVTKEMSSILSGYYGGLLDQQLAAYTEELNNCNGSYMLTFDLSDSFQRENLLSLLKRRGYTERDYRNIINHESFNIPGITAGTVETRGIKTNINYDAFIAYAIKNVTALADAVYVDTLRSNAVDVLDNIFNSTVKLTETSRLYLDGPVYGYFNKTDTSMQRFGGSLESWADHIKKGLAAGAGNKIHIQKNNGLAYSSYDAKSQTTTNLLRFLDAAEEFFNPKVNPGAEYTISMAINKGSEAAFKKAVQKFESSNQTLFLFNRAVDGIAYFTINSDFDFKAFKQNLKGTFDIHSILPIWVSDISKIYNQGNQSLAEWLKGYDIPEFNDLTSLLNRSDSNLITIYNLDLDEYDSFIKSLKGSSKDYFTVENFKKVFDKSYKDTDNYYILSLKNYIDSGLNYSKYVEDESYDDFSIFYDEVSRKTLGKLLNSEKYSSLKDTIDEALITKLAKDFLSEIKQAQHSTFQANNDKLLVYSDIVNTGAINKLNIENDFSSLTVDNVIKQITSLVSYLQFKDSLFIDNNTYKGLPKHNSSISIFTVLQSDADGKLAINLDYLAALSSADRAQLIITLKNLAKDDSFLNNYANPNEMKKEINKTIKLLNKKVNDLKSLGSLKDDDTYVDVIRHEASSPSTPSVFIRNTLMGKGLSDADANKLFELLDNKYLAKKSYKKLLSSSSLQEFKDSDYNPYTKSYIDLLDRTLYKTVDKLGHTIVFNMNSAEARAAFIDTAYSFAEYFKPAITNEAFLRLSKQDQYRILLDIAVYANAYSTGTSIDAEYSGALLINIDKEHPENFNPETDIKPIITSGSDVDRGIYSYLLFGENSLDKIKTETTKEHILLKLDKNSFSDNLETGFRSRTAIIDLDNEANIESVYRLAVNKARNWADFNGKAYQDNRELIINYYTSYPSSYEMRNSMINSLVDIANVNRKVAEGLIQTIATLRVSNETNWTEERVNQVISSFANPIDIDSATNEQFDKVKQILVHGVCEESLTDDINIVIDNYKERLSDTCSDEVIRVSNALVEGINNDSIAELSKLSDEDKVKAVQLFMLTRKSGGDLEYILNQGTATDLRTRLASIDDTANSDAYVSAYDEVNNRFEYYNWADRCCDGKAATVKGITPYNIMKMTNTAFFDTEWLIGQAGHHLYQISFLTFNKETIGDNDDALTIFNNNHGTLVNILIANNIVNKDVTQGSDDDPGYHCIETTDSFGKKTTFVIDAKKEKAKAFTIDGTSYQYWDDGTNIIVNSEEDAFAYMRSVFKDRGIESILGYNNKSVGSDDDWFYNSEQGRLLMSEVNNLDIRLELLNATLSNSDSLQQSKSESLDYLRKNLRDAEGNLVLDIFRETRQEHDASSDIKDTLALYIYLINHKLETSGLYNEEAREIQSLVGDALLDKALTFDNMDFSSVGKEGQEIISSLSGLKKSNSILNTLIRNYNVMEETSNRRISNRLATKNIKEAILGDSMFIRETKNTWYDSVKNYQLRDDVASAIYSLMYKVNPEITSILSASASNKNKAQTLRGLYHLANEELNKAIKLFMKVDDSVKDYLERTGYSNISYEVASQLFFSSGKVLDYLKQTNSLSNETIVKAPEGFFSDIYRKETIENADGTSIEYSYSILDDLASDDTVDLSLRNPGSATYNNILSKYVRSVLKPLSTEAEALSRIAPTSVRKIFNAISNPYGTYDDAFYKTQEKRLANILSFSSSLDDKLKEFITNEFNTDKGNFYSVKALYYMGSERTEFSKKDFLRNSGEYGTVYIGEGLLNKAYPDLTYKQGDTFFTQIWRQPGQGKTMHIMKVVVTKDYEFSMTRTTSRAYFNGDFDGDHYFIGRPTEAGQRYGEAMYNRVIAGSQLLNVFDSDNYTFDDSAFDTNFGEDFTKTHIEEYKEIIKAIASKNNKRAITLIAKLKEELTSEAIKQFSLSDDSSLLDELWLDYGFAADTKKDSGFNFFTRNNNLTNYWADWKFNGRTAEDIIREGQQYRTYSNQYTNDYDSQLVGQISKATPLAEASSSDPNDILYATDIIIGSSSMKQLDSSIENMSPITSDGSRDYSVVKQKLMEAVRSIKELTNGEKISINKYINSLSTLNGKTVASLAQYIQATVRNHADYKDTLTNLIKADLGSGLEPYRQKLNALVEICKMQPVDYDFGYLDNFTKEAIDNMSGPEMMQLASHLIKKIQDYSAYNRPYIQTYNDSTYRSLLNQLITSGSLDVKFSRDTEVISPNGTSSINRNGYNDYAHIGLTKQKIAVLSDNYISDTVYSTNGNQTKIYNGSSISLNNYAPAKIRMLEALDNTVTHSGKELNKILPGTFNDKYNYRINVANKVLAFITEQSFNNLVAQGYVKIGSAAGKNLKGTVKLLDKGIKFEGDTPDLLVGSELFARDDKGIYQGAKQTGTTIIVDAEGNKHNAIIYEVDNMALLDSFDSSMVSKNVKLRPEDTISIVSGLKAQESYLFYGGVALSFDEHGNLTFDPKGFSALQETLRTRNFPIASEVNSMKEINALRIMSLLANVSPDTQKEILMELKLDTDLDTALSKLLEAKDLGGEYGQDIIDTIESELYFNHNKELAEVKKGIKDSKAFSAVWSKSLEDSRRQYQYTGGDYTFEEYFKSKWGMPSSNLNRTSMRLVNDAEHRNGAFAHSAVDCNDGYFYGRKQLLQDILGSYVSKQDLQQLYDAGILTMEELINGCQATQFRGVLKSQSIPYKNYDALTQQIKTGAQSPVHTHHENQEPGKVIRGSRVSVGSESYAPTDYLKLANQHIDGNGMTAYSHTYALPFLGDGSDESILSLMNNNKVRINATLDNPYIGVHSDKLILGNYHKTLNRVTPKEYRQEIKEFNKSPFNESNHQNKLRSAEFKLNSLKDNLDSTNLIREYLEAKEVSKSSDLVNTLLEQYKQDKLEVTRVTSFVDYLNEITTDQDIVKAIKLCSNDNGQEFKSSFFRSWGFASKDNLDISLGQRVLFLNKYVDQWITKIAGTEFKLIAKITSESPELGNILNKYMDMQYKLDLYNTLVTNKKKHVQNLGKAKYLDYLDGAKKLILGDTPTTTFEEAYRQITSNLEAIRKDATMTTIIDAALELNKRLSEIGLKQNPYSLLGYYIPQYTTKKERLKLEVPSYVEAYRTSNEATRDIINGFKKKGDINIFASTLYNSKDGYLGMVAKVCQSYATNLAMKDLGNTLKTNGYMRNVSVYSQAQRALFNELDENFIKSFSNIKGDTKRIEYDKVTYDIIRNKANNILGNTLYTGDSYIGPQSFLILYKKICGQYNEKIIKQFGSVKALEEKFRESIDTVNQEELSQALNISELYENATSIMINIMEENSPDLAKSILEKVYSAVAPSANTVLVDNRGCKLTQKDDPTSLRYPVYTTLSVDDMIQETKLIHSNSIKAEYAKMMLTGDIYEMRTSVADQLESKVFNQYQSGTVGKALRRANGYAMSLLMSNPVALIDRDINFTMSDIGTLMSCDAKALNYLMPAIATVHRYKDNLDSITEATINTDKMLQIMLRYMAATGESPYAPTGIRGEKIDTINIPVIKEWIRMNTEVLSQNQFFARIAYFACEVERAERNGMIADPTTFGVAYHLKDGLANMDAKNESPIYSAIFDKENNRYYDSNSEYITKMKNLDAALAQVVAENVGEFGNLPYGSNILSRLGMIFTGFPLQQARWGKNRIESLAYAVCHLGDKESGAGKYLLRNGGSTLLTSTLLLAFQLLFSQDTQDYLKKKLKGEDEEITDEERTNAENILFRGGCVKLFDSLLKKEEQTSAPHSRSMAWGLWDSYIADFLLNDDKSFWENLGGVLKENLWGHQNPIIKDVVESIPGNTALQTYNWFTPSDNFLENIGRKASGYVLGSAQANAVWDSMKATQYEDDTNFTSRLAQGFENAYIDSGTGIREYKSQWKNYRKAFSILYEFIQAKNPDYTVDYYQKEPSYDSLKDELVLALKEKTSASAFYNIIQKYLDSGTSLATVKSALKNVSLRNKLEQIDDIESISDYLSDSELAVIKSALAYEDYMFPYLDDVFNYYSNLYWEEKNKNSTSYIKSIDSILSNYYRNMPTYNRTYNTNYKNYLNSIKFYNNMKQQYTNTQDPMSAYAQAQKNINYGQAKDIYGNIYSKYREQ